MRRPEFIARQSRCPSGLLGHLLGRVMALETSADNDRALEALAPQRGDHILEVGFGHGRTIARLAAAASDGFVAGVEISERMLRMASRFNRRLIEEGRVELGLLRDSHVPYEDSQFDRVLSVHTIYFWPDPSATLAAIYRVMKPGGALVLGFRTAEDLKVVKRFPASVYKFYRAEEVGDRLEGAGFSEVRVTTPKEDHAAVAVAVAVRPRSG